MKHKRILYLLIVVPYLTEFLEAGHWPNSAGESITELISTFCIGFLVWLICRNQRQFDQRTETDELTGLKNRRRFEIDLAEEVTRAHRMRTTLTLCFIDIDRFKLINSKFGSDAGNGVLVSIGKMLKTSIRNQVDSCYRIGGDEFIILLPSTQTCGMDSIKKRIDGIKRKVTLFLKSYETELSMGVVSSKDNESPKDFLIRADDLMHREKNIHRSNRINPEDIRLPIE